MWLDKPLERAVWMFMFPVWKSLVRTNMTALSFLGVPAFTLNTVCLAHNKLHVIDVTRLFSYLLNLAFKELLMYLTFLHVIPILKESSAGCNFVYLFLPLKDHISVIL